MRGSSLGRYLSPLRYPGGKGKLANYIKLILLENDLLGCDYVEPYAGGASVALSLLFEDYAGHVHINDLNPGVYAFWKAALEHTDELCKKIEKTPVTVNEWHRQRAIYNGANVDNLNILELGFATFFLNRTNRSGIVGGAGLIGGLAQRGCWKLDARYNKEELIRRIRKVGRFRSRISLTRLDALHLIAQWESRASSSVAPALLYLDPPYFVKGEGLYDNFYSYDDHVAVSLGVRRLTHPWVVSYDAAPEISRLYKGKIAVRYSLDYSAGPNSQGSELMFFSSDLVVPPEVPSSVSGSQVDEARFSIRK